MDDLRRMVVFYHVVQAQSFSGAARQLGIARSAVSRHIALLEKSTGVRLINRTTRRLRLTEAGEVYYRSCARIVEEAESATRQIGRLQEELRGTLKVAAPISLGNRFVNPLVREFMAQHAAVHVELLLDDEMIDMVQEGVDVSIRVGWLHDSSLIARKLGEWPRYLCASPDYIERHGQPSSVHELCEHEWLIFTRLPAPYHWVFSRGGESERIKVKGRLRSNNADAIHGSLLAGAGICAQASFLVADDIKAGRLVHLLPEYDCGNVGMYAVYQDRRYLQAKVRSFLDFIDTGFQRIHPAGGQG